MIEVEILSRKEHQGRPDPEGYAAEVSAIEMLILQSATIEALAAALEAAWTHADSHEQELAQRWRPVIHELREKGWLS